MGSEEIGYEYLPHTADVQVHSWGLTINEAFEQAAVAMFGYITELDKVEEEADFCVEVEASGHDLQSLLYGFMDEFLFEFNAELRVCKRIEIIDFDREAWTITAKGYGEEFDRDKHIPGTEVKVSSSINLVFHSNFSTI